MAKTARLLGWLLMVWGGWDIVIHVVAEQQMGNAAWIHPWQIAAGMAAIGAALVWLGKRWS